ncbi:uncharacterized PE-PGRS family protein PE_PGRS54-like [Telopea speciosissima]|uniref:uncharacterized PE-PGRS family protein PE_PGRS54-like n=1 Tax=Telopea speciosissima TaxID=54955 RepID=UPI001CC33F39|nr:uncharacterized PE-PGRS family protein PE_PGRS54-like [Telopea speciosissima]
MDEGDGGDRNVGEEFLQSLRRNEDVGFRNGEEDKKIESAAESRGVSIPGVEGGAGGAVVGVGEGKFEQDAGAPGIASRESATSRLEGFQDSSVFRGNELTLKGSGPVLAGGGGMRADLGPLSTTKKGATEGQQVNIPMPSLEMTQQSQIVGLGNVANESYASQLGGGGGAEGNANANGGSGSGGGGGGGTILLVGDLHWWTTDVELEVELNKYGSV